MRPESNFQIAPNWSEIGKMIMTSKFSHMAYSSNFLTLFCFSCQIWLIVQVSSQCHHWFWGYDNFILQAIDQNAEIGNTPV